jgi:FG-GAP-like repeat
LVDLDGDGRPDILSGSWPGEIYFFRRLADGSFAAGEQLKTSAGKPLNVGSASVPFAFDWDGDGKPDLIVGAGDGSVVWFRNEGTAREPRLAAAQVLVPPSPSAWRDDSARGPADWGVRVKPCVVDWDGDGRPDLLLGDLCGGCERRPSRTPEEAAEAQEAADRLPELRKGWAAAYKEYAAAADPLTDADRARMDDLRARLKRLKDEITRLSDIRDRYRSGYMSHGYVWLFRRLPAGK